MTIYYINYIYIYNYILYLVLMGFIRIIWLDILDMLRHGPKGDHIEII